MKKRRGLTYAAVILLVIALPVVMVVGGDVDLGMVVDIVVVVR